MATDLIRYDLLVQDALRSVLRRVLADTAHDGLPGNHHFVIAFRTDALGVRVPHKLREKYPQEMTIVLQHEFWDLTVGEQAFEVRLHFDRKPEVLVIPFDAVTGFFDPSVEFGLKFEMATEPNGAAPAVAAPQAPASAPRPAPPEKTKPRGSGSEPAEINPKQPEPTEAAKPADMKSPAKSASKPEGAQPEAPAKVVSIDAFRKK
jgi:uncharacterized protein